MSASPASPPKPLVLIGIPVLVAAALRVLAWAGVHEPPDAWLGDAATYHAIAAGIMQGRLEPEAFVWTPGYPLVGILLSPLGGLGNGLVAASFLAGIGLPALVAWAGVGVGLPWVGFVAGLILAVLPTMVMAGVMPLSESVALALLAGTAVTLQIARRRRPVTLALLAGALGGLAVLVRTELALSIAGLAVVALFVGGRRMRRVGLFLGASAAVVLPWVLVFHAVVGTWGVSLKPQINVIRTDIYAMQTNTLDHRTQWERFLAKNLETDGALDPGKLARADVSSWLFRTATLKRWGGHLRMAALERAKWWELTLWVLGVGGLLLPDPRRTRVVAAMTILPVLVVPVFVPYTGRHMLAAVPGLAWGAGLLVSRAILKGRDRRPALTNGLLVAPIVAATGAAAWWALSMPRDFHWGNRYHEIDYATASGDFERAKKIVRDGERRSPGDSRFPDMEGYVLSSEGDLEGAERCWREAVRLGGSPLNLAMALVVRGETEEADSLMRDMRADPPSTWIYAKFEGDFAFYAQRWEDAIRYYSLARAREEATVAAADRQLIAFRLGALLVDAGRADEAVPELEEAARGPDEKIREKVSGWLSARSE